MINDNSEVIARIPSRAHSALAAVKRAYDRAGLRTRLIDFAPLSQHKPVLGQIRPKFKRRPNHEPKDATTILPAV